jgi:hypothetical protein
MPDYSKGKIYKLQCDDGYYYFGSSVNELRYRFANHKEDSKTKNFQVYQHINTIGWDRVRIVLVEDYPCENKQQLIRKEDEYIRLHKDNTMCLNMICAFRTPEQNAEHIAKYKKQHYEINKEEIAEQDKQYYEQNKERIAERKKQHYEANKERIKQQERLRYQNKKLTLTNH